MPDNDVPDDAASRILLAAEQVAAATAAIGDVVVSRCPGSECLSPSSSDRLLKILVRLVRLRQELEYEVACFQEEADEEVDFGEDES